MDEMKSFIERITKIYKDSDSFSIDTAREIVKEINEFLYCSYDGIGTTTELGQTFPYFSDFHKYWHTHHKEILNLSICDDSCEKVADVLCDVYLKTNGKAFTEVYNTNNLTDEQICRVRMLTANQDFRGSRSFKELSEIYLSDPSFFDETYILQNPDDFVKAIGIVSLSQNDKRVQFAKRISQFILEHKVSPYEIIDCYDRDVFKFRTELIGYDGAGYGNKKADMFIRDMIILGVWKNVKSFEKIDVASDVNTIKVALRTGILKSDIPLVSSFLDIFCYQYGYVDSMNAKAWRRVWKIWNQKYPHESVSSPCLLDYFIYNVVGKQLCKEILCVFKCEENHEFLWHSPRNKTCQICYSNNKIRKKADLIHKMLPCESNDGDIAVKKTEFAINNPSFSQCPFKEICDDCNNKKLMSPKSISIMGQTGWSTAYSDKKSGGGGLMA